MKPNRTAVIFDLYGTLADIQVDEKSPFFWNELAVDYFGKDEHLSGDLLKNTYFKLIDEEVSHRGEGFLLNTVFSRLLTELAVGSDKKRLAEFSRKFREHSTVYLAKKEYTDSLLHQIRESGYKLGLISNTEELLTRDDLQVLGLENSFQHIILSSQIGIKKPDKQIFMEMLAHLGVEADQSVYIGDNFNDDIVGALNAELDAIFLTTEYQNVKAQIESKYTGKVVCASFTLEEIETALERLGFVLSRSGSAN